MYVYIPHIIYIIYFCSPHSFTLCFRDPNCWPLRSPSKDPTKISPGGSSATSIACHLEGTCFQRQKLVKKQYILHLYLLRYEQTYMYILYISTYEYICTVNYIVHSASSLWSFEHQPSWEAHYSNFSITWRKETSAQVGAIQAGHPNPILVKHGTFMVWSLGVWGPWRFVEIFKPKTLEAWVSMSSVGKEH